MRIFALSCSLALVATACSPTPKKAEMTLTLGAPAHTYLNPEAYVIARGSVETLRTQAARLGREGGSELAPLLETLTGDVPGLDEQGTLFFHGFAAVDAEAMMARLAQGLAPRKDELPAGLHSRVLLPTRNAAPLRAFLETKLKTAALPGRTLWRVWSLEDPAFVVVDLLTPTLEDAPDNRSRLEKLAVGPFPWDATRAALREFAAPHWEFAIGTQVDGLRAAGATLGLVTSLVDRANAPEADRAAFFRSAMAEILRGYAAVDPGAFAYAGVTFGAKGLAGADGAWPAASEAAISATLTEAGESMAKASSAELLLPVPALQDPLLWIEGHSDIAKLIDTAPLPSWDALFPRDPEGRRAIEELLNAGELVIPAVAAQAFGIFRALEVRGENLAAQRSVRGFRMALDVDFTTAMRSIAEGGLFGSPSAQTPPPWCAVRFAGVSAFAGAGYRPLLQQLEGARMIFGACPGGFDFDTVQDGATTLLRIGVGAPLDVLVPLKQKTATDGFTFRADSGRVWAFAKQTPFATKLGTGDIPNKAWGEASRGPGYLRYEARTGPSYGPKGGRGKPALAHTQAVPQPQTPPCSTRLALAAAAILDGSQVDAEKDSRWQESVAQCETEMPGLPERYPLSDVDAIVAPAPTP